MTAVDPVQVRKGHTPAGKRGFVDVYAKEDGSLVQRDGPDGVESPVAAPGGGSLPDGGVTGQALVKASDDDGDAEWGDTVAVLVDPGNVWEAETAVVEGYRIAVTFGTVALVFEVITGGTTDSDEPEFGDVVEASGWSGVVDDNDVAWECLGFVGGLPKTALARLLGNSLIPDPATATTEDVATAVNNLLDTLRGSGYLGAPGA